VSVKLVERASAFLANRTSRRGFIQRTAFVGSALAVAPLQYVLRPGTAYGAICNCSGSSCDCGARCCDGYTEFCCTITGSNSCPPGTLMAGWWKADGSGFCDVNGQSMPRYYMDCNADCNGCGCGGGGICSQDCTSCNCQCANGSCGNRKSCCTSFRYGQCNQHVQCVGQIVCRVVTCTPPWVVDASCTQAVATDNNTRFHNAACLSNDPIAVTHPDDALVSTSGGTPWIIDGGQRWPFLTPDAFASHASSDEVAVVSDHFLNQYAVVGAGYRDGVMLRTPNGRVYVVTNGVRRHVPTGAQFEAYGLNPAALRNVSDTNANANRIWLPFFEGERLPDGLFVRRALTGQIFRVVNGVLRPVPTPRILASYRVRDVEVATPHEQLLATLPVGPGLGFRDGSLLLTPDGKVWVISLGERRHILSPDAFHAMGYRPESVMMVSAGEAALHPEGRPLDGSQVPEGGLVRSQNGPTVWLVQNGRRYFVQHPDALSSRAADSEVAVVDDRLLNPLPVHVRGWRDGVVLRTPDGVLWLISEGQRRRLSSTRVLTELGYTTATPRAASADAAAVHPVGDPISSGSALVDGMFVRAEGSDTVYRIEMQTARPITADAALQSWHVRPEEIAVVDETRLPDEGDPLGFRDGTVIRTEDGVIWVISNFERRHLASPQVMTALGYGSVKVYSTTYEIAEVHPQGGPIT
jgi:hypothetical protein